MNDTAGAVRGGPVSAAPKYAVFSQHGSWSASTRYRATQHLAQLRCLVGQVDERYPSKLPTRRPGHSGQVRYFATHGWRYMRRWSEVRNVLDSYDSVFVQRGLYEIGPDWVTRPLERFGGRVVLDLDDALFVPRPALAEKGLASQWLYGPQQVLRLMHRADAVIVSTPALAAALPVQCLEVVVLPTLPAVARHRIVSHSSEARTVGWVGTNGGLTYLDPLRGVFEDLRRAGVGDLEVVSSRPWRGPSTFRQWHVEDEFSVFDRFAVGIMPLPDTPYTRAKAGFKLLQYMASGVPVVASPIGVNVELVERSMGGFLANTPRDWSAALRRLLSDVEMRADLGSQGRRFVEQYARQEDQPAVIAQLLTGRPG